MPKKQDPTKAPSKITEEDKGYARATTRLIVAQAIWKTWEKIQQEENLDQQWLADRLGKNKSQISRLMKGPGNWTLDTVSDLLEALESRITNLEIKRYKEIAKSSEVEPALSELGSHPTFWNVINVTPNENLEIENKKYLELRKNKDKSFRESATVKKG